MSWRPARSLVQLRAQLDRHAPHRSLASDGTIGDSAHAARASDHNANEHDVVTAEDFTHDPAHGADMSDFAELLRAGEDPRLAYVIWDHKIFDGPNKSGTGGGGVEPWIWRRYDGADPHTGHLHISVAGDPELYDDPSPWLTHPRTMRRGDEGPAVRNLERALRHAGYYTGAIDGDYGPVVAAAVNALKHAHGWHQDGVAGPRVLRALGLN